MKPGGLGHKDKRGEGEEGEDGGQGRSLGFGFMVLQASEGLGLRVQGLGELIVVICLVWGYSGGYSVGVS